MTLEHFKCDIDSYGYVNSGFYPFEKNLKLMRFKSILGFC